MIENIKLLLLHNNYFNDDYFKAEMARLTPLMIDRTALGWEFLPNNQKYYIEYRYMLV